MDANQEVSGASQLPKAGRAVRRLTILLVVVVFVAAALGIAWYEVSGRLRTSEPYRAALALVENDPQVAAHLGQPVRDTWLPPSGSVSGENADFMFKVAGPKGKASVRAEARRFDGKWTIRLAEVVFADDGKRISLNTMSADGGEGDAPRWTPPAPTGPKPKAQSPDLPPFAPPLPGSPKSSTEPPKLPSPGISGPDIQLDLPDVGAPAKPAAEPKAPAAKSPGK
jgi:hypothetical protein